MSKDQNPTRRIAINDDGDWPELSADDVREEIGEGRRPDGQPRNATLLTLMLGGLFLLYTAYAMMKGDLEMLRGGFDFVKLALAASVSWTFGRRSISGA